jgi:transcriptional regulator with XRE-family HTH domain
MGVVGGRVRMLREGQGLSLRDLSSRSGVSTPMLSQVERGETSPTLAIAERIAGGLGLSLSQLVRLDEGAHVAVVRRGARVTDRRDGHRRSRVTPDLAGQRAVVAEHELAPGAAIGGPRLHEPGSQEVLVVQEGRIRLALDGAEHALAAGDTATFDSDLPHRISNPGDSPAVFLSVVTAGLRRA